MNLDGPSLRFDLIWNMADEADYADDLIRLLVWSFSTETPR